MPERDPSAVATLRAFASHRLTCRARYFTRESEEPEPCDCGLDAVLASLAGHPQDEPLQRRLEISERQYDRLKLCPDHRDKTGDYCIVCQAEKRTRDEASLAGRDTPPRARKVLSCGCLVNTEGELVHAICQAHGMVIMLEHSCKAAGDPPAAPTSQRTVIDFGAVGDGVHDDTTAIREAIDAVAPDLAAQIIEQLNQSRLYSAHDIAPHLRSAAERIVRVCLAAQVRALPRYDAFLNGQPPYNGVVRHPDGDFVNYADVLRLVTPRDDNEKTT